MPITLGTHSASIASRVLLAGITACPEASAPRMKSMDSLSEKDLCAMEQQEYSCIGVT